MRRWVALVTVMLLAPWGARAASFQVNPVRVVLSAAQPTAVLHVTNTSDTPTVVQLQSLAWSQNHGHEVYAPSRALLATPPIFTIAPGHEQIVRIGLRGAPDAKQESSFRLFLNEVPPAPQSGFRGLQIVLRIGIPVFVEPATPTAPALHWSWQRLSAQQIEIRAANTGSAHVEILKLLVGTPGQKKLLASEFGGYVLPGATHTWSVKLAAPLLVKAALEITADTDQGRLHAELPGS